MTVKISALYQFYNLQIPNITVKVKTRKFVNIQNRFELDRLIERLTLNLDLGDLKARFLQHYFPLFSFGVKDDSCYYYCYYCYYLTGEVDVLIIIFFCCVQV
ncbi:Hypothetical_protein [Hexamita inflata]|uniref:Hypothetical_protein n=1 Tax=Hexamita inflata TaxID=28002 RepID=A0ABP1IKP7_9EUKA